MTGIYTGDGERNWIFYTLSLPIFGSKLNEALAPLPSCRYALQLKMIPIGKNTTR